MIKVVLDTNVLISALLKEGSAPAMILSLLRKKQFLLCLTQEVVKEIQSRFREKKVQRLKEDKREGNS